MDFPEAARIGCDAPRFGKVMKKLVSICVAALWLGASLQPAFAQRGNQPCSKGKGGVSHCRNGKFICKDGSTSASKQVCSGDRKSRLDSEARPL